MEGKLTLYIDKKVIERAKKYAKQERRSLSDIVENYLKLLTNDIRRKEENQVLEKSVRYSPIDKLRGSMKYPKDLDYKEALQQELINNGSSTVQ